MVVHSAGILLHRAGPAGPLVLLGHMGGPFWARKDAGAWSIPKGEYAAGEDPLAAARREFAEELGSAPPQGEYVDLGELKQPSRKIISAFAAPGDFDPASLQSNRFELEWPPKSGRLQSFPEVDRAQWFTLAEARGKIQSDQAPFIDRLLERLAGRRH